jgi:glycosyltransferase involved in cell wall biosynthesis
MQAPRATVSVIIPLYNARETIGDCLAAARAQTGFGPGELEIIVIDDGSTDGSADRAEGRCDRLIRLASNQGAATARNVGASVAAADVLAFVDADVVLAPGALAALERELKEGGADGAVGRYRARPAAPGVVSLYHNAFTRYHHDLSPREMDWFWGALGMVTKAAFTAAGGFDERYRGASAEDMELGLALARAGARLRYCPEAEGAHAHRFNLKGMLQNDYRKAVLGTKLRLLGRLPRRAPGFMSLGNVITAPAILLILVCFGLAFTDALYLLIGSVLIAVLLIENEPFYRDLRRELPRQLDYAVALHWLQMAVICAGAAAGAAGWLLGRGPYGKPGWI